MIIVLDCEPLALATNPSQRNQNALECREWIKFLLRRSISIYVAEIAYYEVRRNLILEERVEGRERLDEFVSFEDINYAPITKEVILKASELWAWARKTGQQTAHDKALDADVILAATAIVMASQGETVVIATDNEKHLARYTPSEKWRNINDDYLRKLL